MEKAVVELIYTIDEKSYHKCLKNVSSSLNFFFVHNSCCACRSYSVWKKTMTCMYVCVHLQLILVNIELDIKWRIKDLVCMVYKDLKILQTLQGNTYTIRCTIFS